MDKIELLEEDLIVDPGTDSPEQMITEYVETGEGDGISIIPLHEEEIIIDGKKKLIVDNQE